MFGLLSSLISSPLAAAKLFLFGSQEEKHSSGSYQDLQEQQKITKRTISFL